MLKVIRIQSLAMMKAYLFIYLSNFFILENILNKQTTSLKVTNNEKSIVERENKNFNLINKILDEMWRYIQYYSIVKKNFLIKIG